MLRPFLAFALTALLASAPALAVPPKAFNTSSGPKMGTRLVKPRVAARGVSINTSTFKPFNLPRQPLAMTPRSKDLKGSFPRVHLPTISTGNAGSRLLKPTARWASTKAFQSRWNTFSWGPSRPGTSRSGLVNSLTVIRR